MTCPKCKHCQALAEVQEPAHELMRQAEQALDTYTDALNDAEAAVEDAESYAEKARQLFIDAGMDVPTDIITDLETIREEKASVENWTCDNSAVIEGGDADLSVED